MDFAQDGRTNFYHTFFMNRYARYSVWACQLGLVLGLSFVLAQANDWLRGSKQSEVYPNRPIKLVVPFKAGGGTDKFARIIKKGLEDNDILPEPLVIINQGGAGATIGSRRVKDEEPDGYTVLILHDAILTAKYSGTVDYGPEAFEPIAGTGEVGMVIAVMQDSPYESLNDLMMATHQRQNPVTFGANLGALTHFAGLQLEKLSNARHGIHPPATKDGMPTAAFRFAQIGGGAERFADLKGGHINVTGFSIEEFLRFESEGLKGLAYFGAQRHPAATHVLTAREQGFDVISTNTFYWWFPKGTPNDRIDVMASALQQVMQTEYVRGMMEAIHCQPVFVRGDALQARLDISANILSKVVTRQVSPLPNLPGILLCSIACLVFMICLRGWRRRHGPTAADADGAEVLTETTARNDLGFACIVLTVVYVIMLSAWQVDFRIATSVFAFAIASSLSPSVKSGCLFAPLALLLAFGVHYVFTQLFIVDLFQ